MENKILHICSGIRPGGGPSGYLYNLHMASKFDDNYFVVDDSNESSNRDNTAYRKIKWIPKFLLKNMLCFKYIFSLLGLMKIDNEVKISNFKYVLCHSAPVAARALRLCDKDHKVKIGFMPHGPVSYTTETLDDVEAKYGCIFFRYLYSFVMSYLENKIFLKSSFIVTAAKEGLESYNNITIDFNDKIFEVTTGLPMLKCKSSKQEIRKKLGISDDKFVVGFFGRYNSHKGYDYFYDEAMSSSNEHVLYISAGAGPITKPDSCNYKNYGWRSDIEELISACDIVAIPNRHTYFDLLPLECFSLSRPVAASYNGGNKKLCKLSSAALPFELKSGKLNSLIDNIYNNFSSFAKLGDEAKTSFKNLFSDKMFVNEHNSLFLSLDKFFDKNK